MTKWDLRFLRLAKEVSTWSKDPSTRCGAVLVRGKNDGVVIGYNGLPPGIDDSHRRLLNRDIKLGLTIHAEHNAILAAGGRAEGACLYVWPFQPCSHCASIIIRAGVARVVSCYSEAGEKRWGTSFALAREVLAEAGVQLEIASDRIE